MPTTSMAVSTLPVTSDSMSKQASLHTTTLLLLASAVVPFRMLRLFHMPTTSMAVSTLPVTPGTMATTTLVTLSAMSLPLAPTFRALRLLFLFNLVMAPILLVTSTPVSTRPTTPPSSGWSMAVTSLAHPTLALVLSPPIRHLP